MLTNGDLRVNLDAINMLLRVSKRLVIAWPVRVSVDLRWAIASAGDTEKCASLRVATRPHSKLNERLMALWICTEAH